MEVILLEKVRNLGDIGDKVNVRPGYGRNFLIPQKKADPATPENIELFEQRRAELEKKAQQSFAIAEERAAMLNDTTLVISAMASDEGRLYGSVSINEIKESLQEKNIEVSKNEIVMPDGALHSIGHFIVEIHVHSDVIAKLQVEIVPAK